MWRTMESLPFLGRKGKVQYEGQEYANANGTPRLQYPAGKVNNAPVAPSLKATLERKVYRPGDMVVFTIDIINDELHGRPGMVNDALANAILVDDLIVEVRGIEKLDPQWLITPKLPAGSKQRRGERTILKSPPAVVISDVLIAHGSSRTYMVRMILPKVLPPTYRGTAVRYLYYVTTTMHWSLNVVENGHGTTPAANSALVNGQEYNIESKNSQEVRTAIPIWTLPNTNGLTPDNSHFGSSGIVPPFALEVDIQWREKGNELSNWAWAMDANARNGDDRVSTPKSDSGSTFTSPTKSIVSEPSFDRSFSSASSRINTPNIDSFITPRRDSLGISTAELTVTAASVKQFGASFDSDLGPKRTSSSDFHINGVDFMEGSRVDDDVPDSPCSPVVVSKGRSYNIRMDDEVLVRFSPKNPTSTYFFGDMVAGTLQFFHEERSRRCLEVTAVLETREVLNAAAVHPSRKNSSTITKVYSEYFEVVCDVISTHFLFSIPLDGPASISTPLVSLEWILRFEFVAAPVHVNRNDTENLMLIDLRDRQKGEWSMPLIVHTTPPKKPLPEVEKPVRNSWARSPRAIYKSIFEEYPEKGLDAASPSGSTPGS